MCSNTKNYLWFYMVFMMTPAVLGSLEYSGNYKGAWIYQTIPIEDKSAFIEVLLKRQL